MQLSKPYYISSRLMAAIKIGDGEINLEFSKRCGTEHRTRFHYVIEINGKEYSSHDLQSGNIRGAGIRYGYIALLSFLAAAGESYKYNGMKCVEDTNTDGFPEWVCEWAYQNGDELSMAQMELEDNNSLIIES